MKKTLAFIMAGGRGERLMPLTQERAKPAVPFGGIYRLIDLTLSNCINSDLYKIIVLPQYKSQSLTDHLEAGWNIFNQRLGHFLKVVPPQQRISGDWYRGTADSIRQNLYLIEQTRPHRVLILSGDHIYKMDYSRFLRYHLGKDADLSIALLELRKEMAHGMGIGEIDEDYRIHGFQEKPKKNPKAIPSDPSRVLASMGIYLFNTATLLDALKSSNKDDFGQHIIPRLIPESRVYAYPFRKQNVIEDYVYDTLENGERGFRLESRTPDSSYWRDVGTLDAYWNANMDLTGLNPSFNLYGRNWPIHTYQVPAPPAKFVFSAERPEGLQGGNALDSLVSPGSVISGIVRNSVISYYVVIQSCATVEESVIMDDVVIGLRCKIKKAIIDKHNVIPADTEIGYNPNEDMKRFTVTPRGIVVVPMGFFQ
ncbi:MAG: glucose-1-phosphate adenylyltransferase [Deltaproteobacteria bacterium]|nr:MAG: glucose-1-phosphate adenylyltransferase [Deltaproteobacteria bacterium]